MKRAFGICLAAAVFLLFAPRVGAQKELAPRETPLLILTAAIPLPNVEGRIDHFSFDPGGRVFLSALGNNTLEVIDTYSGTRARSIHGIPHPQGVAYATGLNKIFVASYEGKLYIYDGTSYALITSIDFNGDVDNLRYDAAGQRVYVGYGDGDQAAIGMVDATTNQRLDDEFKLGAHPESFQLEKSGPRIFVNLPDLNQVAAIDRTTHKISRWPLNLEKNFPMALDEADHRLFIGARTPPRLVVFDTSSGKVVATLPCVADMDDLYYDAGHKRVYIPGGQGFIDVFQQKDADHYQLVAEIPSALGARTAGYFGKLGKKGFDRFYVAVPARAGQGAELLFFLLPD